MNGWLAASILTKATVITAAALGATRLARKSPAAVRHLLLAAAFAVLLALPIASAVAPPVRITVPIAAPALLVSARLEPAAAVFAAEEAPRAHARSGLASPRSLTVSLPALLLALWIAGAALFLLPVVAGLWQTRSIRRSGRPWLEGQSIADRVAVENGIHRRIEVLLMAVVTGPMTCGIVRPAIVLPADAQSWTPDDLQRAIVHELEHVRRGDWLTQSIARAVTACYWFHPLVRIAWRQLTLEAERACDDAVLRQAEPTAYADQLVILAQRMLRGRNRSLLAMAHRADLPSRVGALLDSRQRRGPAGAAWVALACVVASTLVTSISPLRIATAAQPASEVRVRTFDVASVKPCREEPNTGGQRRQEWRFSPGRVSIECLTVDRIIYFAYGGIGSMNNPLRSDYSLDSSHVRGGPGWIRSERFTIVATAEGISDQMVMMGPMLRALLEDRFQLKVHREAEDAPMYALTVAKGGLKIRPLDDGGCTPRDAVKDRSREDIMAVNLGPKPVCGSFSSVGNGVNRTWTLGGKSMSDFANSTLSSVLDRHVIDGTGVPGLFNIHLEFGLDESIRTGVFGGAGVAPPPAGIEKGPSIFTALEEQLGLKLERTKGPRDFIVVDRVQRPTPD